MAQQSKNRESKSPWKRFRGKVQETWTDVSGDELDEFEDQPEKMVEHIEKKTGKPRKDIESHVKKLEKDSEYSFGNGSKKSPKNKKNKPNQKKNR